MKCFTYETLVKSQAIPNPNDATNIIRQYILKKEAVLFVKTNLYFG